MKKILATLSLLSALFAVSAQANVAYTVETAKITSMQLDPNYGNTAGYSGGMVEINGLTDTVRLTLFPKFRPCPVGRICPAYMPAPRIVELPVVSRLTDRCGDTTIVARRDQRPVDGNMEEITVRDMSQMTCELYMAAPTVIELRTISSGFNSSHTITETHSTFLGTVLQREFLTTEFAY